MQSDLHADPQSDSPADLRSRFRALLARFALQEDLNFLLTNRIPRRLVTQFMGLVQQDRPSTGARSVDRHLAPVRRPESGRGRQAAVCQLARLFHSRAQAGRAPHRSRPRAAGQSLRRDSGRLRARRGDRPHPGQGLSVYAGRSAARSGAGRSLPRRSLRHVAADLQHVPPVSRPGRLPRSSRSPTSRATPGTPTRSPSSGSSGCSARTNGPSCTPVSTPVVT